MYRYIDVDKYMYSHALTHTHIHTYIYICVYIWREREREREIISLCWFLLPVHQRSFASLCLYKPHLSKKSRLFVHVSCSLKHD